MYESLKGLKIKFERPREGKYDRTLFEKQFPVIFQRLFSALSYFHRKDVQFSLVQLSFAWLDHVLKFFGSTPTQCIPIEHFLLPIFDTI